MDIPDGLIRVDHLDIELDQAPLSSAKPQRVKLYNMATLPKKIQLWLMVGLSYGSLVTNFTSILSSVNLFLTSNSSCKCPPRL